MIDPHKTKYHPLYWLMVDAAAAQSVATRHQVGAILVTPTGMISVGWNGTPSGMNNICERGEWVHEKHPTTGLTYGRYKTSPEVIHAERNCIDKMTRQGVPTEGSILFLSRSPCLECAKALQGLGLKAVYFDVHHDDLRGKDLLNQCGTPTESRYENTQPYVNTDQKTPIDKPTEKVCVLEAELDSSEEKLSGASAELRNTVRSLRTQTAELTKAENKLSAAWETNAVLTKTIKDLKVLLGS